jgi:hypothetical protein
MVSAISFCSSVFEEDRATMSQENLRDLGGYRNSWRPQIVLEATDTLGGHGNSWRSQKLLKATEIIEGHRNSWRPQKLLVTDWNYSKQTSKFLFNKSRKSSIPQRNKWDKTVLGKGRNGPINNILNWWISV